MHIEIERVLRDCPAKIITPPASAPQSATIFPSPYQRFPQPLRLFCMDSASQQDLGSGLSAHDLGLVDSTGPATSHKCSGGSSSIAPLQPEGEKECSMCGDIGIRNYLFQCSRCRYRYQHIYCSRSYPRLGSSEMRVCNWCLHEDDKIQEEMKKLKQLKVSKEDFVEDFSERRNNAFNFLLQVAQCVAQSLPETGRSEENIQSETGPKDIKESDMINYGRIPKRQRCNHATDTRSKGVALQRCRRNAKDRLQLNPPAPKAVGRRYKLLADVVCL